MAIFSKNDAVDIFYPLGFESKELIGSGASSTAYMMEVIEEQMNLKIGTPVVVKVPNDAKPNSYERFEREIELRKKLAELRSEEIIQYYGSGKFYREVPFIVEEFGDSSLHLELNKIKFGRKEEMTEAEMDSTISRIAKGLSYLHNLKADGQGYLHRDIKPGNIFIVNGRPKIGDFGGAGINSADKKWRRDMGKGISSSGMHGSDNYSAPESLYIDGKAHYSIQSDVYSLAITAFNLLTFKTPFDHLELENSPTELFVYKMLKGEHKDFLNEQYDKVIDENPELEYKINAIRRATLPNRTDRQSSVNEFLEEYLIVASPKAKINPLETYLDTIVSELEKPVDEETEATKPELIYAIKDAYSNMLSAAKNNGLKGSELDKAEKLIRQRWDDDFDGLMNTLVSKLDDKKTRSYIEDTFWKHYGVMKAWGIDIGDGKIVSKEKKFLDEEDNSNIPIRNAFSNFLDRLYEYRR